MFEAVRDASLSELMFDARVASGFRAVSISTWYALAELRFAVVWKLADRQRWTPKQKLIVGGVQEVIGALKGGNLRPELVSVASGADGSPQFALVVREAPSNDSWLHTAVALDWFEERQTAIPPLVAGDPLLDSWSGQAIRGTGQFSRWQLLRSACLYRATDGSFRVAAITEPQSGFLPTAKKPALFWGYHVARRFGEDDQAIAAIRQHPALWPVQIQPFPAKASDEPRAFIVTWEQSVGEWHGFCGLTNQTLEAMIGLQLQAGLSPVRLHGCIDAGGTLRYGVVFAKNDVPRTRSFHVHATPAPLSPMPAWNTSFAEMVDDRVLRHMREYNVRTAHLAIGRNGRLALASGYTLAEPDHPIATPLTRTRVASITKVVTKIAILQALAYGEPGLGVTSAVYPLLKQRDSLLKCRSDTLKGQVPPDDVLKYSLQIWHLLTHTSGWSDSRLPSQDAVRSAVLDANAYLEGLGPAAPCNQTVALPPYTREQYERARYAETDLFEVFPGIQYEYSNWGYFLLGRLIETIGRTPSGLASGTKGDYLEDEHFLKSLWSPLGVGPAHFSVAEGGAPDLLEAFYPCDDLQVLARSLMDGSGNPILLSYYWDIAETMSGYGNLALTMAAVVRMLCAFDLAQCPLLPPIWSDTFLNLLDPAGPYLDEAGSPVLVRSHGATMVGARGGVVRRMDGGFTASYIANRGAVPPDLFADLNDIVNQFVANGGFPDHDLFPVLGMESFP